MINIDVALCIATYFIIFHTMEIDDEESHLDSTHPLFDEDSVISSSKRCLVVEAETSKLTSSERNKRSR